MINFNKVAGIIILFFFMPTIAFSQKNTDGKFLFKTWFYLEHLNDNSLYNIEFPVKDSSILTLFINDLSLKIDTLKSNGFSEEYIFLAVNLKNPEARAKGKDSSLMYSNTRYLQYIVVPTFCNRYVLCVNKSTGFSYRLQGFIGNDFLNLLKEIKDEFYLSNKVQLKTKAFLKNYTVDYIDFECIYKGLQSGQYGSKKFSCLGNCLGSKEIIWTQ